MGRSRALSATAEVGWGGRLPGVPRGQGSETGLGDTCEPLVHSGDCGLENAFSWWQRCWSACSWGLGEPSWVHRTAPSLWLETVMVCVVQGLVRCLRQPRARASESAPSGSLRVLTKARNSSVPLRAPHLGLSPFSPEAPVT